MITLPSRIPLLIVTLLFKFISILCKAYQAKENRSHLPNWAFGLLFFLRVEIRGATLPQILKVCFYDEDSILNFGFIMNFPLNILQLDF
jgi:hypothetical protein